MNTRSGSIGLACLALLGGACADAERPEAEGRVVLTLSDGYTRETAGSYDELVAPLLAAFPALRTGEESSREPTALFAAESAVIELEGGSEATLTAGPSSVEIRTGDVVVVLGWNQDFTDSSLTSLDGDVLVRVGIEGFHPAERRTLVAALGVVLFTDGIVGGGEVDIDETGISLSGYWVGACLKALSLIRWLIVASCYDLCPSRCEDQAYWDCLGYDDYTYTWSCGLLVGSCRCKINCWECEDECDTYPCPYWCGECEPPPV